MTIPDGPAYIIGKDFHLGDRYDVTDMARDCGCPDCMAILQQHGMTRGGTT